MSNRPNILFILSDQHAFNVIGSYGNKIVRTPNLDKLANNGVSFDNVYVLFVCFKNVFINWQVSI